MKAAGLLSAIFRYTKATVIAIFHFATDTGINYRYKSKFGRKFFPPPQPEGLGAFSSGT
jgi:hypothetical protein